MGQNGVDLAIIGSGGAAFAAAIAARDAGKRVVMVERGAVGGTCVNVGCVPSKALLAAAAARHTAQAADRFPGIAATSPAVTICDLIAGKNALVDQLRAEKYIDLATEYGVEVVSGSAVFAGNAQSPALRIALNGGEDRHIAADHYLVATGAAPWAPPVDGLAEAGYLTSTTAMELRELPASLVVVGGNAVGLELAQLFSRLGVEVTVVEALGRLAPFEEPEISLALEAVLTDEGVRVVTGATLSRVRRGQSDYTVTAVGERGEVALEAEQLLIATGRRPATAGLGLDRVGVESDERGAVVVDEFHRSTNARIWAAGDVVGGPQFVYVAAAQGTLVADNALSRAERSLDYTALPRVTFTTPAIASVGMTDAEATSVGLRCDCRTLPLKFVPRALADRDTRGLVKIVAESGTGRLLGVHALADGAGELITAATYAITAGLTVEQLAHGWAPYLTMSEALKLAAQSYTRDVTKLSCCAA